MHKIIINLGVAAYEQSNVVGERFLADDSFIIQVLTPVFVIPICVTFKLELLHVTIYAVMST